MITVFAGYQEIIEKIEGRISSRKAGDATI